MKRDHMMGYVQTAQHPDDRTVYLSRRFPLGVPKRVYTAMIEAARHDVARNKVLDAFESVDHTPAHMQKHFPAEYDVLAMAADKVNETYSKILAYLQEHDPRPRDRQVAAPLQPLLDDLKGRWIKRDPELKMWGIDRRHPDETVIREVATDKARCEVLAEAGRAFMERGYGLGTRKQVPVRRPYMTIAQSAAVDAAEHAAMNVQRSA